MDLDEYAETFVISTRMQEVARALDSIMGGKTLETRPAVLDWVAEVTGQIDFDAPINNPGISPEIKVVATRLRPLFFELLSQLRIPNGSAFLGQTYKTLKSYGARVVLSREELMQARELYGVIGQNLLVSLQAGTGQL
jgi:hypothetical protein